MSWETSFNMKVEQKDANPDSRGLAALYSVLCCKWAWAVHDDDVDVDAGVVLRAGRYV